MTKTHNANQGLVFLGLQSGVLDGPLPRQVTVADSRCDLVPIIGSLDKRSAWVSFSKAATERLIKCAVTRRLQFRDASLLLLAPPRAESLPSLLSLFSPAYGLVEGFRWLPRKELVAALTSKDAWQRIIGGIADPKARVFTMVRGNLEPIIVPFSFFTPGGDGTKPDFGRLGFTDYGHTVVLGEYEASADVIFHELDPAYRRWLNKHRKESERSFGAALYRLRLQKRLRRVDFAPISSKEIARIERNEVARPHQKTLDVLAARLDVRAEEIETF